MIDGSRKADDKSLNHSDGFETHRYGKDALDGNEYYPLRQARSEP